MERGFFDRHAVLREVHDADGAVRAFLRASVAAGTPRLDHDIETLLAPDRAHGAANHTQWVHAGAATGGNQVFAEAQSFAEHQADIAFMRRGASPGAIVAPR